VNAVTTAHQGVLVQVAVPKSSLDAGQLPLPEAETVQARGETATATLESILRSESIGDRRKHSTKRIRPKGSYFETCG